MSDLKSISEGSSMKNDSHQNAQQPALTRMKLDEAKKINGKTHWARLIFEQRKEMGIKK